MASFLPPEILDNIFEYVRVSPQLLLVCRNWYYPIRRRLFNNIKLSSTTLFQIPMLSDEFMEPLFSCTHSISIILDSQELAKTNCQFPEPYSEAWVYGINTALIHFAWRLQSFQRLQSFIFGNYLEIETSWNVIWVSTFINILSGLSNHDLDFVKIDMPGADLENRLQLYAPWANKPHGCEILSENFPRSRHVHVRMREICSELFSFGNTCRPRLEMLVVDLNLETNSRHQLDQDNYVTDCQFAERFAQSLLSILTSESGRLSCCSQVPNLQKISFLCKIPHSKYGSSEPISHTVTYNRII
jgi:hypothetical protein